MDILVAHFEAGGIDNCASYYLSLCTWQCCVQQSFGGKPKMQTIPTDTKYPCCYGLLLDASFVSKII